MTEDPNSPPPPPLPLSPPPSLQHGRDVHPNLPEFLLLINGNILRVQGQEAKATTAIFEIVDELQRAHINNFPGKFSGYFPAYLKMTIAEKLNGTVTVLLGALQHSRVGVARQ